MKKLETVTAEQLQSAPYAPVPFLVEELLPEGLAHPCGRAEDRQVLAGTVAVPVRFAGPTALEFCRDTRGSSVPQSGRFLPAHPVGGSLS